MFPSTSIVSSPHYRQIDRQTDRPIDSHPSIHPVSQLVSVKCLSERHVHAATYYPKLFDPDLIEAVKV